MYVNRELENNKDYSNDNRDVIVTPLQHLYNTSTTPLQHLYNTSTTPLQHLYNTSTTPLQHLYNTYTRDPSSSGTQPLDIAIKGTGKIIIGAWECRYKKQQQRCQYLSKWSSSWKYTIQAIFMITKLVN